MTTSAHRAALAALVLTLCVFSAAPALALSAFWHGVISEDWNQGSLGGIISNWYSKAPPNGIAQDVPDETAIFASGAQRFDLFVDQPTSIETLLFKSGAPNYNFQLDALLNVTGQGVVVKVGSNSPQFIVNSGGGILFRNLSDPGEAVYTNNAGGLIDLGGTKGPGNNRRLTARSIFNEGNLLVGSNLLRVRKRFKQVAGGLTEIHVKPNRGRILASSLRLNGTLRVIGKDSIRPGRYLLLRGSNRIGKFSKTIIRRFKPAFTTKITYDNQSVYVVVSAP